MNKEKNLLILRILQNPFFVIANVMKQSRDILKIRLLRILTMTVERSSVGFCKILILGIAGLTISITGCKKDNPDPVDDTPKPGAYETGIFISCEGPFGSGTGTVSFYDRSTGTVTNDLFGLINSSATLGNVVQSMSIHNDKAYMIVNNAGKIEIVTYSDFKTAGTISGLNKPRYFLGINSTKAYVTEWGSDGLTGAVKVINLSTNTVSSTISTGNGPEEMIQVGESVYVACGKYGADSIVTVINSTTDAVVTSLNVGIGASSIISDANNKIWVLCGGDGYPNYSEPGKLVRIDPTTNTIELTMEFSAPNSNPSNLNINNTKDKMYFIYGGSVYEQSTAAVSLNTSTLINRSFYGLSIDPTNDYIYGADAGDYVSDGWVIRYNSSGTIVDSFQVGVIPNGFAFN